MKTPGATNTGHQYFQIRNSPNATHCTKQPTHPDYRAWRRGRGQQRTQGASSVSKSDLELYAQAETDVVMLQMLWQRIQQDDTYTFMDGTIQRSIHRAQQEAHQIKGRYEQPVEE